MKENISKHQNFIKDKVFESCKKIYDAELLFCEGVNGFNQNEIDEANRIRDEEQRNILLRMQDYETFTHDDDLEYLNFNDYD